MDFDEFVEMMLIFVRDFEQLVDVERFYGRSKLQTPEPVSVLMETRSQGSTEEDEPEMPEVPIRKQASSEQVEPEQAIVPVEEKPDELVEWSTADLGNTLRELRTQDKGLVTRALRKLHVRWWHSPATRMKQILSTVGLPESVLSQIKDVCDTCRICRAWARPSSKSMTTTHAQTVKNTVWHRQERVSIARLHALGSSVSLPGTRKELSPSLKASVNRLTRPKSIEVFEFEEHGTPPLALRRNSASDFTFPSASDMSQYMAAIAALPETGSKHR
jgi:hypothetical protein